MIKFRELMQHRKGIKFYIKKEQYDDFYNIMIKRDGHIPSSEFKNILEKSNFICLFIDIDYDVKCIVDITYTTDIDYFNKHCFKEIDIEWFIKRYKDLL